ncbi:histidinol-phosphate aminotransferase [Lewinella marina]|uniref:Histidinol-phosphate aminotransferase n=1 Tax=Neolewinella marina TaxID=438751 RepID=A0A2G0CC40_9BACT|nr:histidinol-phosphate transaminase [Neolewinella marina]NJB86724.1 histidinol-phosphate aminotransferase [Neolewinella marina]PHK97531.1 histidinol-phosphate transaminase [Neolewinella marina]
MTTTENITWTEAKIKGLVRPNILNLTPYSSARSEFKGRADVLLDANESPFDTGVNRYPEPLSTDVREALAKIRNVHPDRIFLGNGSDEIVDQVTRVFCIPGKDSVVALPPTFGMYKVAAGINDVGFRAVTLQSDFTIPVEELKASWDDTTKVLWLCSPNNPSGNLMDAAVVEDLIRSFPGIVVLDEAYIDFVPEESFVPRLDEFPNLIITQTLSKAWGMAGVRLGAAYASEFIITMLRAIKMPYNINVLTKDAALDALAQPEVMQSRVDLLIRERRRLERELGQLPMVDYIFPSVTNFLLVRFTDSDRVYRYLLDQGIVVRNQSYQPNAKNCLRITAGTPEENTKLIEALRALGEAQD